MAQAGGLGGLPLLALLMARGRWESPRSLFEYLTEVDRELAALFKLVAGHRSGSAATRATLSEMAARF